MRQRNGAELFGANDPRAASVGIIEIAPEDDRQSILTALLTQDKLNRKQTVIVLSAPGEASRRANDFKDFETTLRSLRTQLVFVAPKNSPLSRFARQHNYQVFANPGQYTQYARTFLKETLATPTVQPEQSSPEQDPRAPKNSPKNDKDTPREITKNRGKAPATAALPPTPQDLDQEPTRPLPQPLKASAPSAEPPAEAVQDIPTRPTKDENQTTENGSRDRQKPKKNGNNTTTVPPTEPTPIILGDPLEEEETSPAPVLPPPDDSAGDNAKKNNGKKKPPVPAVPPIPPIPPTVAATPNPEPEEPRGGRGNGPQPPPPVPFASKPVLFTEPGKTAPTRAIQVPAAPIPTEEMPTQPIIHRTRSARARTRLPLLLGILLLIIILAGGCAGAITGLIPVTRFFPGLASATITITPDHKPLQKNYAISAVEEPDTNQVHLRVLPAATEQQTKAIPASGKGQIAALSAQGILTFYNRLDSAQDLPAGTILTGPDGIQIITKESVRVPAASRNAFTNDFTEGNINVAARALLPGGTGNIPARTFDRVHCCAPSITVENSIAFTGGREAQSYTYVQQNDITQAALAMIEPLQQKKQSELLTRVTTNERLIDKPLCQSSTTSDRIAGERAEQVNVIVSVTCAGTVYNLQEAQILATNQFKSAGTVTFGTNYAPANEIHVQVSGVKTGSGGQQGTFPNEAILQIQASGLWAYQITEDQQRQMIDQVVGKSKSEAESLLRQQKGVKEISIDLPWYAGGTLPAASQQITSTIHTP
jgi:hypothetical protein